MQHWLFRLPSLVLVGVALVQIHLASNDGLAAWSGGGFGMFSTPDAGGSRHLHAVILRPGLAREVEVPESLRDAARRALVLPSDTRLQSLARALAQVPTPDHGRATGVRVQVWAVDYASETLQPSGRLVNAVELAP